MSDVPTSPRIGVVGGGIVGLAVARRLALELPDATVVVLEKEDRLARHQTGHNSGVVHAGLYYAPGSLKATLCRRGVALLKEYCQEKNLPYDECGKLVVARDATELPALEKIWDRATANGVPDIRRVGPAEIRDIEPATVGAAAILSPRTAITDFVAVANAYADDVRAAGGTVRTSTEVVGITAQGPGVELELRTPEGPSTERVDRLVVCAGLHSDRVARWAGDSVEPAIVPFRGEYYRMRPEKADIVRGLVYPVPDPAYPFLGVHFTRRVDGGCDIGPNAVLAAAREGYRRRDVVPRELLESLAWPGFRRLATKHWRMGAQEVWGSLSKRAFLARARDYVPSLRDEDVVRAPAGVRAQALDRDGALVDDFRIGQVGAVTTVRNAPSPAATSSLAIAEHVVAAALAPR